MTKVESPGATASIDRRSTLANTTVSATQLWRNSVLIRFITSPRFRIGHLFLQQMVELITGAWQETTRRTVSSTTSWLHRQIRLSAILPDRPSARATPRRNLLAAERPAPDSNAPRRVPFRP